MDIKRNNMNDNQSEYHYPEESVPQITLDKLDLLEELVKLRYRDRLENNDGTPEDISMKRTYNRQFIDSRIRYIIDYQIPMSIFIEDVMKEISNLEKSKEQLGKYAIKENFDKQINYYKDIIEKIKELSL